MAAQMLRLSSQEKGKLIEDNVGEGELDFESSIVEPRQDLSWLEVKPEMLPMVPHKDINNCEPAQKKRNKPERSDMENRIIPQRKASKGFLQNRQMGKASKKNWNTDIAYIRNLFTYITVWIEAKLGE